MAIFGNGKTYDDSQKNREYFMLINQDLPEEKWLINCILICSGNPRIKPRRRYVVTNKKNITILDYICSSFKIVKWLFKFFADGQIFNFPKLFQYGIFPQPPSAILTTT